MPEPLPTFRYHPDPVGTGSVVASDEPCPCCGRARGFTYVGPLYAEEEPDGTLCPWCIADGTAARRFDAEFTDVGDAPDAVADDALDELARRTPGFSAWQQDHWLYHCDDGCEFLGPAGHDELRAFPDAGAWLRRDLRETGWEDGDVDDLLGALSVDDPPTAYLFRCRVCGEHLAYADTD